MENELKTLLLQECIILGDFTLHSGDHSDWKFIIENMSDLTKRKLERCIAQHIEAQTLPIGIESGGAYIVREAGYRIYRYGTISKDGILSLTAIGGGIHGQWATLVDDVVTTGTSLTVATQQLRNYGIHVVHTVCVLNRSTVPNSRHFQSLLTISDVENYLRKPPNDS